MKNLLKNTIYTVGLLSLFLFASCSSMEGDELAPAQVRLSFDSKSTVNANGRTSSSDPSTIHVSIRNEAGDAIYNLEELSLLNFDGSYLTAPVILDPGKYYIHEFIITDEDGDAIYISPKSDSDLAYLVEDPLDIEFRVGADDLITVVPEVLSTSSQTPESFGYTSFGFAVVESFDILVSASIHNKGWELTTAVITIKGDGDQIFSSGLGAETNQLTINDGFEDYEIKIEKDGYKDYEKEYSAKNIKKLFDKPLHVHLKED